ncbi:D-aminoacyl-tRNA deacylase 1 isoform X1 [Neocloeon triangulifer]|uniref:D-aminoacyl-tRNA deacylase 1 isoform X1 n=1 Tax=Neocloeon triangulifer TaxID=2078957 RepID=UPI00286EF885|nr:D-aminoacyl-tRNA deacylase 1 isoform X1 [Neocloeon triangulifer]XP_059469162.1 D-aminoacyl-tRNA deacylase 1 isoform X1 [Neocloeon triangulifer]
MRALIQRVRRAQVSVNGEIVSSIEKGLCVLIGICRDDGPVDLEYIVRKILNVRLFDDDSGVRWKSSVKDKQGEILCISQFTLYHELKGNKPDFHNSMGPDAARSFYDNFLAELRKHYKSELVKDGKFGEYMQVEIENDGPVTIMLESPNSKNKAGSKGETDNE